MTADFYARDVCSVAADLIGYVVRCGECAGVIVETEAYHESEPACHAYVGRTRRTETLFGPPGRVYMYLAYGLHAMLNAVCEADGVGAAVLIRALEPLSGLEAMRARRRTEAIEDLCSGPGRLTQALAVTLDANATDLQRGPVTIGPPRSAVRRPEIVESPRVGITKAVELRWRYSEKGSRFVSRPRP